MRAFFAVRIPATPALERTSHELAAMQPAMRMANTAELHVTLAFLGETDDSLLPDLMEGLRAVASTEKVQALTLHGLGVFPREERPNVVWAGFDGPEPLRSMARLLADRCERLGFPREKRPYHPHVTLARIKRAPPATLGAFVRARASLELGDVTLSALTLFRSDTRATGPVYTELGSVSLVSA